MPLPAALAFLAGLLKRARAVREDRGDPREDDYARRSRELDEEIEEIEDEEEEG